MFGLLKLRRPVMQGLWGHIEHRAVGYGPVCGPPPCPQPCPMPSSSKPCIDPPQDETPPNWVSYGFDYENRTDDYNAHNASFFFTVTLCLVFGGFAWAYAPDVCLRDWAQREAFLELHRRESAGSPPIDPNYIPVKNMKLPAPQDLCDLDFDITI